MPAFLSSFAPRQPAAGAGAALARGTVSVDAVLELVQRTAGGEVDADAPLMEAGLDSLGAVELRNGLQALAGEGTSLPSTLVFDYPTARLLAGYFSTEEDEEAQGVARLPLSLPPPPAEAGMRRISPHLVQLRAASRQPGTSTGMDAGAPPAPLFCVSSMNGVSSFYASLPLDRDVYALEHAYLHTADTADLAETSLEGLASDLADVIAAFLEGKSETDAHADADAVAVAEAEAKGGAGGNEEEPIPVPYDLIGVSFGSFLAHHIALAGCWRAAHAEGGALSARPRKLVLIDPWPVPPYPTVPQRDVYEAAAATEAFQTGRQGTLSDVDAYVGVPPSELGLQVAQRVAAAGGRPFTADAVVGAMRQIAVVHHHQALLAPFTAAGVCKRLPRLPSGVFVFLAFASGRHAAYGDASMFSTSAEANAPAVLRAYYGAALADEIECEGEHLDVCERCATGRVPAFNARLRDFLDEGEAPRVD